MTDLKPLIDLVQAALIPGLIYGLKLLWDIREHLVKLNGRVATCEALRLVHTENDERQHDQCEKRLETVERKLMGAS